MMRFPVLVAAVLLACSCAIRPTVNVTKPLGESVVLELGGRTRIRGELVAVSESSVVLIAPDGLRTLPCSGIRRLTVLGYDLKVKRLAVLAPVVAVCVGTLVICLNQLVITMTTSKGNRDWAWFATPAAAALIPLACLVVLRGDPRTSFAFPLVPADMELLRLYARYPEGLTPERLELLRHP